SASPWCRRGSAGLRPSSPPHELLQAVLGIACSASRCCGRDELLPAVLRRGEWAVAAATRFAAAKGEPAQWVWRYEATRVARPVAAGSRAKPSFRPSSDQAALAPAPGVDCVRWNS